MTPMTDGARPTFDLDGARFSTLEEFFDEVSLVLIPGSTWGRNLDGFNDILRGGFGTPDGGFRLIWRNHVISQQRLGYPETARQLELRLERCHPSNKSAVADDLVRARNGTGATVYDWLVKIIRIHCAGGPEEDDGIELVLQ